MNAQCNVISNNCCVDNHQPANQTGSTRSAVKRVVDYLLERRRQRINRADLKVLLKLDDDMLKDIGLSRGDVRWASHLPLTTNAATELEILARRAKRSN